MTTREEYLLRPFVSSVEFLTLSNGPREAPETPPEHLPLECHTRAGFSLANQPA
jgi:hypothetical protein